MADAADVAAAVGIRSADSVSLQQEFVRLPGDLAYWTSRYADAAVEHQTRKLALERIEAQLAQQYRIEREADGKKATEAVILELVHSDDDWLKVRTAAIKAEGDKLRIHGIVEAISAKKDMLVTVGAHIRAEMAAFPSVGTAAAVRQHNAHQNQPQGGESIDDWVHSLPKTR